MVETNPDKAIKRLPVFYAFVGLLAVGFVIWLSENILNIKNDLFNASALVLEGAIGLMIAWTVYVYSKKWKVENDKVTEDIKKITEDLNHLTNDIKKIVSEESQIRKEIIFDLSYHLNSKLDITIRTLKHSLEMFENWKNKKNGETENWKNAMLNSYKRTHHFIDFKINLLDLMKIYGVKTSRAYWKLLGDLQITSEIYAELDERNISEFAVAVEEGLSEAEELKKIIMPLGTEQPN